MDVLKKILFVLAVFGLASVEACPSKFKNGTDILNNLISKCGSTLAVEEKDIGKLTEMLKDPEQDDKCLSKCIMEKLDTVKDDKFDVDAFFTFLEDQAPKALVTKITETVTKCGDSAGLEKLTTEKPQPNEVCSTLHKYYACFISSAEKLC